MSYSMKPYKQFRVLKAFTDRDTKQEYQPGELYPVQGTPKKQRIQELKSHPGHDYQAFIEEEIVQSEPPAEPIEEAPKTEEDQSESAE